MSTARLLMIDDDPARVEMARGVFDKAGRAVEVEWLRSPSLLNRASVERATAVLLDHDMCAAPDDEPCPETGAVDSCGCPDGMDAVRMLLDYGIRRPVVIHSANRPAGCRMYLALRDAEWTVTHLPVMRWSWFAPAKLASILAGEAVAR